MFRFAENKKRAFSFIFAGTVVFLILHLAGDYILPAKTPSFLRLLISSIPFFAVIAGIFLYFGESSEKNKSGV